MTLDRTRAIIYNPPLTAGASNVTFNVDRLDLFLSILYSAFISTKILFRNYVQLNLASFREIFVTLVSVKILKNDVGIVANVSDAANYLSGAKIPVLMQNIINVVPSLPRQQVLPVEILGISVFIDQGNILRTWAQNIVANINYTTLSENIRFWSDPLIFKGALCNCTFNVTSFDVLLVTTNYTERQTGGPLELVNLQLDRTNGPNAQGASVAVPNVSRDSSFTIEFLDSLNITPQLLFFVMAFGVSFLGFRDQMHAVRKSTIAFGIPNMSGRDFVGFVDEMTRFPNPEVVDFDKSEENKTQNALPENKSDKTVANNNRNFQSSKRKPRAASLRVVKIRKAAESKVSGVKVVLKPLNMSKKLTTQELAKVETLIGNIYVQAEKVSNILQIQSEEFLQMLPPGWSTANEEVDENFGEI